MTGLSANLPRARTYACIRTTVAAFQTRFPDKSLRILDVGARDGFATHLLRHHGYLSVTASDIEDRFIEMAYALWGVNVTQDDFSDTKLSRQFDVVYGRHVAEHLPSLECFFRNCAKVLVDCGWVFATLPIEKEPTLHAGHLCCCASPGDLLAAARAAGIVSVEFGMSDSIGIRPTKTEMFFRGRAKCPE